MFGFFITSAHAKKFDTQYIRVSGTANINKDMSENGVIPFKRYIFNGDETYNGPSRSDGNIQFTMSSQYFDFDMIDGQVATPIGNGFYIVFGVRDSRGDTWPDTEGLRQVPVQSPGDLIVSVVTKPEGTDFTGVFDFNSSWGMAYILDLNGKLCVKDPYVNMANACAIITVNLHFIVSNSTCQITTSHNMAFSWASLSPSEISNGSAEVKTAPVTMRCGNSGGIEPVAVTFTPSNGIEDANNGIIKTNKSDLGIQLTWASNGLPVQLDKETNFPALRTSTEDLSINAQPVQLGSTSVGGGSFSTRVTMNIEYR